MPTIFTIFPLLIDAFLPLRQGKISADDRLHVVTATVSFVAYANVF
jgi:hypothetical protein